MRAAQTASFPYPASGSFDEAVAPDGTVRPAYRDLLGEPTGADLNHVQAGVQTNLAAAGVEFGPEGMRSPFAVDCVPRVIDAAEWSALERGLAQRVRALQTFLADVYSRQEILKAGVIRASILDGAPHYEPVAAGFDAPVVADLAGPDLVRDAEGFRVLEDNLRFPSGLTFARAAREAVAGEWPGGARPVPAEPAFDLVGEMLRSRDPAGTGDPAVAILSEGPRSAAWFEHRSLASALGVRLVTIEQLEVSAGRLIARDGEGPAPIDVLYNRSDTDRITRAGNGLTPLGEILIEPLRSGRLACLNSFGAGIADDKAIHCYTPEMIEFYLDEKPLIENPESYDLGDPAQAETALDRLDELVIKPRWALGGQEIVIGPKASARELDHARRAVRSNPSRFVAQETIGLSTHPTLIDGRLEPRHVDLRPYVVTTGGTQRVAPLALSRFARAKGDLVVSSTQGGGAKDTWILAA